MRTIGEIAEKALHSVKFWLDRERDDMARMMIETALLEAMNNAANYDKEPQE